MNERVSNERLAEMLAGLEGATPGPWRMVTDYPSISIGAGDYRVVQTANQNNHRRFGTAERWIGIEHETNATHIARCDPDTIRSLIEEVQASRRQSPAGVEVSEQMLIDAFLRGESWRKRNDVDRYVAVPEMVNKAARDYADATLACLVPHEPASGDTQDDLPLADETQGPAGVEPVVWLSYVAFPPDGGDARYEIASPDEDDAFPVYASPPPKAVTITDEIEPAPGCTNEWLSSKIREWSADYDTAILDATDAAALFEELLSYRRAALPSEAHNG